MYNDFRFTSRENWKFTYKGIELQRFVDMKFWELDRNETKARMRVSALLADSNISAHDERINQGKKDIERYATEREQCLVFSHECRRTPDKEFTLSIGDITYFNIALPPAPLSGE